MPLLARRWTNCGIAAVDHGPDEDQVRPGGQEFFRVVVIRENRLLRGLRRIILMRRDPDDLLAAAQREEVFGVRAIEGYDPAEGIRGRDPAAGLIDDGLPALDPDIRG